MPPCEELLLEASKEPETLPTETEEPSDEAELAELAATDTAAWERNTRASAWARKDRDRAMTDSG